MRISFQSMYAYPSHWEHFPMLNTYRVSTFQIFNRICIYIYIYVCIDYALLHFDSLPATRTKSSSLSLSLALSPLLSRLNLRKECSRITQTDRCSENKNDSYMIIWSILIPPIRRILVDASAVKSIGELFHAPNPPDSEIESTTLRIQVRWKWPMAQAPRS